MCKTWVHHVRLPHGRVPVVLMGDAAHTAHFSIGSGTKLALEDAIDLADIFAQAGAQPDMDAVLQQYEDRRSVEVLKIQNAARNSTEWFENVTPLHRHADRAVRVFAADPLAAHQPREPAPARCALARWLRDVDGTAPAAPGRQRRRRDAPASPHGDAAALPPMLLPLQVRGARLKNRIVVSPMATYSAVDGVVQDFHLVHLGARALGGAALVMVEMTSPTPEGRITPGCTGLWNDAQEAGLRRIVDFVHGAEHGLDRSATGPQRPQGLDPGRLGADR